jgi:hypothetical protein
MDANVFRAEEAEDTQTVPADRVGSGDLGLEDALVLIETLRPFKDLIKGSDYKILADVLEADPSMVGKLSSMLNTNPTFNGVLRGIRDKHVLKLMSLASQAELI